VDLYLLLSPAYWIANLLFGVAVIVIAVLLSRKYGTNIRRSRFIQALMDDISGKNLNAVKAHLSELRQFEQESQSK
jgi:hypothetical protein